MRLPAPGPGRDACHEPTARPCARPRSLRRFLRCGLFELQRRDQLFDVLDLEQSALVLVMGSTGIRSPAFRRLAVAKVEKVWLLGSSMSSQSEHGWTLRLLGVGRLRLWLRVATHYR